MSKIQDRKNYAISPKPLRNLTPQFARGQTFRGTLRTRGKHYQENRHRHHAQVLYGGLLNSYFFHKKYIGSLGFLLPLVVFLLGKAYNSRLFYQITPN